MAKNKLTKVNVPELFYIHFLKDLTATPGSVLELIHGITPSARGRGFSRVIPEVTQAQYDELYELGMNARAAMSGGVDRETVLRAAICAKAMCERMEAAGVSNPQPFVPKRATKVKTTAAPVTTVTTDGATVNALNTMADDATDEPDTNLNSIVPAEPATLDTADDLEEVSDEELDGFGADIGFG